MQAPGEATGGSHGGFMADLIEIKPTPKMMWAPDLTLRDENKTISAPLSEIKAGIDLWHETMRLVCIKDPLILRYLTFREPRYSGAWKIFAGKVVSMHLSVQLTVEELTEQHKARDIVCVLMFLAEVPYRWDGLARFLILRRVQRGQTLSRETERRWERIGVMQLEIPEHEICGCGGPEELKNRLPLWRPRWGLEMVIE
jgi:hypothetical protein